MHKDPELQELFDSNRQWAEQVNAQRPGFFTRLLAQQTPQYLWIGCSDSRVPANELVGLLPGDIFVHRNIANVVATTDLNVLSVVQYAVDVLKVRHIIIVGHSNCGGVTAALNGTRVGLADNWLRHVQKVRDRHMDFLTCVPEEHRVNALCELNVLDQAVNISRTTIVEDAWARGQEVVLHGWVYGLHNGLLHDLQLTARCASDIAPAYERALAGVKARYCADRPLPSLDNPELHPE